MMCQAFLSSTNEQCIHESINGTNYCQLHQDLIDCKYVYNPRCFVFSDSGEQCPHQPADNTFYCQLHQDSFNKLEASKISNSNIDGPSGTKS
jgi:hypothetical protein